MRPPLCGLRKTDQAGAPARLSTNFPRPVEKSLRLRLFGGSDCANLAHIIERMFEFIAQ